MSEQDIPGGEERRREGGEEKGGGRGGGGEGGGEGEEEEWGRRRRGDWHIHTCILISVQCPFQILRTCMTHFSLGLVNFNLFITTNIHDLHTTHQI